MSGARSEILARISAVTDEAPERPRPPRTEPAVARDDLISRFTQRAEMNAARVERLESLALVPEAVARALAAQNLPARLCAGPGLNGLDWGAIDVQPGRAGPADSAAIFRVLTAVAETGSLLITSAGGQPMTQAFLPDLNIAVLMAGDLAAGLDEALAKLRAQGPMPRATTFITGPSRTGDIEQTMVLGAHGPRSLTILIVDEA